MNVKETILSGQPRTLDNNKRRGDAPRFYNHGKVIVIVKMQGECQNRKVKQ